MVSEWAVLRSNEGVAINYYGPSDFSVKTPEGHPLTIREETEYPREGKILLQVGLDQPEKFALKLRIPSWSRQTRAFINGKQTADIVPGSYLESNRTWNNGDRVELDLDLSPHYWAGEREEFGKTSLYVGPILLAFDPTYNTMGPSEIPAMDAQGLTLSPAKANTEIQPWLLKSVKTTDGKVIVLCDFATAGAYGNQYVSWLPIQNVKPQNFDRNRQVWTTR
jgi:hypothetical protein